MARGRNKATITPSTAAAMIVSRSESITILILSILT